MNSTGGTRVALLNVLRFQKRAGSTRREEIAMTTAGAAIYGLSPHEHGAQLRRAVISFIATALLPDYTNRDVSREYDGG
jgi:O-acetyl-ADP-ribose deacetylase (regulator of RNase III)